MRLEGELPDALAMLAALELLDLGDNSFEGTLPQAWAVEGAFPSLKSLDLAGNGLSGPITEFLAYWTSVDHLKLLSISHNSLTGQLPARSSSQFTSIEASTMWSGVLDCLF
jgi:hypothetical protein